MVCKAKLVRLKWISIPVGSLGEGAIRTVWGDVESVDLCEDIGCFPIISKTEDLFFTNKRTLIKECSPSYT